MTQSRYYSETGCDGMGMCCKKKTMIGWRNVWSMKWRVPGQEVEQRKHTYTHNHFTALWILSGTTPVSRYQNKHSPTYTYRGHQSSLMCFLHLLQSMASSLFNLHALQSFSTISLQVFFGLPLGLTPSTSYSIHFFTQSLSSFHSTCPYHCNLSCCSTEIMSSNPSLSLEPFTWNAIV